MKPSLVIFDCDGVLVDSEPLAAEAFAAAAGELGHKITVDEVDAKYRGRSLNDCMGLLQSELGRPLPPRFRRDLDERTYSAFEQSLREVPGVTAALQQIQSAKVPTCVASSGTHEKMQLTLRLTGLLPFLEKRLFSASQVKRGKPAPDLFLFAAKEMGFPIVESVVIEDSLAGAKGACAAGARVLGYCPSGGSEAAPSATQFKELGVEPFAKMEQLPGLLSL